MPRPRHQLDDHRNYIEQTLLNHESIKSIHQNLCQNFGYTGTALTIRRRIASWGLAMPAKQARTSDTNELRDRICELFFQYVTITVSAARIWACGGRCVDGCDTGTVSRVSRKAMDRFQCIWVTMI